MNYLSKNSIRSTISLLSICQSIQRCVWLASCDELAYLGRENLMKIVNNLSEEIFEDGEPIFLRNRVGSKLVLIESGTAHIKLHKEILEMLMTKDETDNYLGIIRPEGEVRRPVHEMTGSQLLDFVLFHSNRRDFEDLHVAAPAESLPVDPYAETMPDDIFVLSPGCLVGSSILRGKARLEGAHWNWINSQFVDELWSGDIGPGGKSIPGSKSPLTIRASGRVRCLSFSVELFEQMFGVTDQVLSPFKFIKNDDDTDRDGDDDVSLENEDDSFIVDDVHIDSLHHKAHDDATSERSRPEETHTPATRRRRLVSCFIRSVEKTVEILDDELPPTFNDDEPVRVIPIPQEISGNL